jgi:hypothetical protein
MRLSPIAPLIAVCLAVSPAIAQTFTIEQPKSNKKGTVKVVRPGEVTVDSPSNKAEMKSATKAKKFEEANPAPSEAQAQAKAPVRKNAVKTAKKANPKPIAPPPQPEVAETRKPAAPVQPPALDPVPTLSHMSTSELQQKIEAALRSNPNISSASGVRVRVSESEIRLEGTIANGREKIEAARLAQSYSLNRLFKDQLQIAGSQAVVTSQPATSKTGAPTTVGNNFNTAPK